MDEEYIYRDYAFLPAFDVDDAVLRAGAEAAAAEYDHLIAEVGTLEEEE